MKLKKILSISREKIALDLDLIEDNQFAFCWIVDYPMFELDEKTKKLFLVIILSQCSRQFLKDLNFNKPLEIKAFQYDIVAMV